MGCGGCEDHPPSRSSQTAGEKKVHKELISSQERLVNCTERYERHMDRKRGLEALFAKGVAFKMALEEMAFQEAAVWKGRDKHCLVFCLRRVAVWLKCPTYGAIQEDDDTGKENCV